MCYIYMCRGFRCMRCDAIDAMQRGVSGVLCGRCFSNEGMEADIYIARRGCSAQLNDVRGLVLIVAHHGHAYPTPFEW